MKLARFAPFALALIAAACGSAPIPFPSDDIALPSDAPFDNTLPVEASADAGPDGPKYNGGGPFTCGACICDGTLDLCASGLGGGGVKSLVDDAGADAGPLDCPPNDAGNGCVPMPIGCFPKPTCECLMQYYASGLCSCDVDDSGAGFFISCLPPP